ncbi:phage portal protein [Methylobacterium sp. sgz302541]|uniref:phage portal protein n=1 Tax=unclassified Methylobacterium TaxID=2615210 RepID=UPI003D352D8E
MDADYPKNGVLIPRLITFKSLSIPPEDAQLLETRGFNIEVICRWFGVLPVMIGHMDKATAWGTGLEQMNLWFLTYTLRSHLKAAEQAIWSKCLTTIEQRRFFPEFNVEGLMRADSKGRAELYRAEVTNALSTPNEIRARENKPPLPGGDQLFMQGAMLPIELLGTPSWRSAASRSTASRSRMPITSARVETSIASSTASAAVGRAAASSSSTAQAGRCRRISRRATSRPTSSAP